VKKSQNFAERRLAIKLFDKGFSINQILKKVNRSRSWFYKWQKRFTKEGLKALLDQPKTPHHSSSDYCGKDVSLVLRIRKRLENSSVGLIHAGAVQQEIKEQKLMKTIPSVATINRWLASSREKKRAASEPYYPSPRIDNSFVFHSMDWVARYLKGGEKLFAFHTIDFQTHDLAQTLACDKTTQTACSHLLHACNRIGLPDFLQIDNDSAFNAIGLKWGFGGRFLRLSLFLGIEIIFIPAGEARRNGLIEAVNHLWSKSYFSRNYFKSVKDAKDKQPVFLSWYEKDYFPPSLNGENVSLFRRKVNRRKLTKKLIKSLPKELPLTKGRVHFIRRVSSDGQIKVMGENFKVSKSLFGRYVWAVIEIGKDRMLVYHRKSERAKPRLVKTIAYKIDEKVQPLKKEYRRRNREVDILEII
jgi:hypothetical protein